MSSTPSAITAGIAAFLLACLVAIGVVVVVARVTTDPHESVRPLRLDGPAATTVAPASTTVPTVEDDQPPADGG